MPEVFVYFLQFLVAWAAYMGIIALWWLALLVYEAFTGIRKW